MYDLYPQNEPCTNAHIVIEGQYLTSDEVAQVVVFCSIFHHFPEIRSRVVRELDLSLKK